MNAIVKPEKIETIFNHQVTKEEFKQLFDFEESQEDYEFALSQTDAYIYPLPFKMLYL
jgi:hydroxymethylpyrimidine pyrophosphatase-like HAD family hydrolase